MQTRARLGSRSLWMLLVVAAPALAQVNLVVNGSFEQPALGFGSFGIFGSIPGWTTTVGSGIEVENHAAGTPFAGNQLVEMDSNDNSGMQQAIPTTAGQAYVLSFEYSPRPGVAADSNGIEVRVNGNVIDTIAQDGTGNADTVWTHFTYNVTGIGSSTTIEFRAVGISDGVGGFLDAVRFKSTSTGAVAAIPMLGDGPLVGLALLLALAAFGVTRTRRNR